MHLTRKLFYHKYRTKDEGGEQVPTIVLLKEGSLGDRRYFHLYQRHLRAVENELLEVSFLETPFGPLIMSAYDTSGMAFS